MDTRFGPQGQRYRGFLGSAKDGSTYLACPGAKHWTVVRCDGLGQYRAFGAESVFTPEQLDQFTSDQDVTWFDDGNGIYWYSHDMIYAAKAA